MVDLGQKKVDHFRLFLCRKMKNELHNPSFLKTHKALSKY